MYSAQVRHTYKGFFYPAALPNGGTLLSTYGFLIKRGEELDLEEFAKRIEAHYDNPRTTIEAGEIRRWYALMQQASKTVADSGRLPESFEWEDGTYDTSDISKILGENALQALVATT